jgi:benzoyl-CoA 2,3-dioxygenase component A
MASVVDKASVARQHLIDPELCIRCNTCEATCPVGAVTHDDRNYVVKFDICNACNACISPCPTGAIDNWRQVVTARPYTIEEQLSWDSLPLQESLEIGDSTDIPEEVERLTTLASEGVGGVSKAPWSAEKPYVNLFGFANPAVATVAGNFRLTDEDASSDIRHIVLDFGATAFPVLEGQTIGIVPPGVDGRGKPHYVRLYSIASPRNGERPKYNNVSLTVKRVTHDHSGNPVPGVGSNYLCDLAIADQVKIVGPYGANFLMPNHPGSSIMMICTGTGSAPMRAMTEWRRRRMSLKEGGQLLLFFGARSPSELPYFGPLTKLPKEFIDVNLAFSRLPGQPKQYVQDLIRERADAVVRLLEDDNAYIYVCGVKGMEQGVEDAFREVCRARGLDWDQMRPTLLQKNRLHIETY